MDENAVLINTAIEIYFHVPVYSRLSILCQYFLHTLSVHGTHSFAKCIWHTMLCYVPVCILKILCSCISGFFIVYYKGN